MKALLGLWRTAKTVQNPVLRLLAMAVAGYLVVQLCVPIFVLNGLMSGFGLKPGCVDFWHDPLYSNVEGNVWHDDWHHRG